MTTCHSLFQSTLRHPDFDRTVHHPVTFVLGCSCCTPHPQTSGLSRSVLLEEGFDVEVADELSKMGHRVEAPIKGPMRQLFGRGQIIRRDSTTGVLAGGSDPRADGQVLGW